MEMLFKQFFVDALGPRDMKQRCVVRHVDANGEARALTDGILLVRYLFGFNGAQVARATPPIDGFVSSPIPVRPDCRAMTLSESG